MGRENIEEYPKTNEMCYCLGGDSKLRRGKFLPLNALKKTLYGIQHNNNV